MPRSRVMVFVCDSFGPAFIDKCNSLVEVHGVQIAGVQVSDKSVDYDWSMDQVIMFPILTLFSGSDYNSVSRLKVLFSLIAQLGRLKAEVCIFHHYDRSPIFLAAMLSRLFGRVVVAMIDSKFDDYERNVFRECAKVLFLAPYNAFIAASPRSVAYLRYLNVRRPIVSGSCNFSVERVRKVANVPRDDQLFAFNERPFLVVSRFLPRKNVFASIDAYSQYLKDGGMRRRMLICGGGELEEEIRSHVDDCNLRELIEIFGFLPYNDVLRMMSSALCLLLLSTSEQFGICVAEAMSLGCPAIVSINCGVRDFLVQSEFNGYVVEPDNVYAVSRLMQRMSSDLKLWSELSDNARSTSIKADARTFASSVEGLLV